MIVVVVEEIPGLVDGKLVGVDVDGDLSIGHFLANGGGVGDGFAIGPIEREHRLGGIRAGAHDIGQLVVGDLEVLEQRVAEHLFQGRGDPDIVLAAQLLQVDVVDVVKAQQQLHRERALVAFEKVEVTG